MGAPADDEFDFEDDSDLTQNESSDSVTTRLTNHQMDSDIKLNIPLVSNSAWKSCGKYPRSIKNFNVIAVCTLCRDKCKEMGAATPSFWEINIGKSLATGHISNHH